MPINSTLPNALPTYDANNEAQTRQSISLAFQQLNQIQAQAFLGQRPQTIAKQSWWLQIDDATLVATLYYMNSAGVTKSLVVGTLS